MPDITRRALIGAMTAVAAGTPRTALADDQRIALRGYDPVSYFTVGRPEKGSAEFAASFDDVTYWFKSAEHRAMFVADPDRYAPQFGGFCAVSLSRGQKYEADPEAWAIADGRLYVFGAKDVVPMFRHDMPGVVAQATRRWPELRRAE